MPLPRGERIGPYVVEAWIGAGGMGEVYRARDARLGRTVALKLPADGLDEAARRRIAREARALARVPHRGIGTLFDVGEDAGRTFLVLEYLDGETLRERLDRGRLSTAEALRVARDIADTLAAAHEAGVVHRDLKPSNVMLTADGVRLMDFGIAGAPANASGSTDATDALDAPQGSVPYAAPEQIEGGAADPRSDLFALGVITYEMLAGQAPFAGASRAARVAAVLGQEPPSLRDAGVTVSPALERTVLRCVAKDPRSRWQTARDLAEELRWLESGSLPRRTTRRRAPVLVALVAVLAAAAGAGASRQVAVPPVPSVQRLTVRHGTVVRGRLAPDGQGFVFSAYWDGRPLEVFAGRVGQPEFRPLGLPEADLLSLSRGGDLAVLLDARRRSLGRRGTLAVVPMAGGAPRPIAEDVFWADWAPDGRELAVVREEAGQTRLELPLGHVLATTPGEITHPRVSPDGRLVAFMEHPVRGDNAGHVSVVDRAGRKRVLSRPSSDMWGLAWRPDGREVWFTGRAPTAVTLEGEERPLAALPGVVPTIQDVADDGRLLVVTAMHPSGMTARLKGAGEEEDVTWMDRSRSAAISSDAAALLFHESGVAGGTSYATFLRRRRDSYPVKLGPGTALALSPDGQWAVSMTRSPPALLLLPTGVGQPITLSHAGFAYQRWAAWLPEGRGLLFSATENGRAARAYHLPLSGGTPRPVTAEGVLPLAASPDGRRLLTRDAEGRHHVQDWTEAGTAVEVKGLGPDETPIGFHADGRMLYVRPRSVRPVPVHRLDPATGARTLAFTIRPPEAQGLVDVSRVQVTPDGAHYAYSYERVFAHLYVMGGVR
jgi:hypothetical protein